MQFEQITIIGVGLIGGSVGLAAKARKVARHVVGVDRNAEVLQKAQVHGAIDSGTTNLAEGVRESQLVVVCTPVDRIAEVVALASQYAHPNAVFTDVGSAKGGTIEQARTTFDFVPAHPLAGSEKSGVEFSPADLFAGRVVVIVPGRQAAQTLAVETFWASLGARIVRMNADFHDAALAFTSHLPHAVASAVAGVTSPNFLTLTAGGFRDVTRIAAGDPKLWTAIFQANAESVLAALTAFTDRLNEFRTLLEAGDRAGMEQWLSEGKQVRDALGT